MSSKKVSRAPRRGPAAAITAEAAKHTIRRQLAQVRDQISDIGDVVATVELALEGQRGEGSEQIRCTVLRLVNNPLFEVKERLDGLIEQMKDAEVQS